MLSALLAVIGLYFLSTAQGLAMIFIFATLYGFGKTFFWPTMLGVVSEQCPKGGALTLNAIAGIGMLTVGIVGGPLIGKMQEDSVANTLPKETYEKISVENSYLLGKYTAVEAAKVSALGEEAAKVTNSKIKVAKQGALANITVFPIIMLIAYIALFFYFKGRGGYKSVEIGGGGGETAAQ
jgi:MFS family permease